MKRYQNITRAMLAVFLLAIGVSCEKSEVGSFEAEPAVNFARIGNQFAASYSFLTNSTGEYIQEVPVRIMGFAADQDREFNVDVVSEGTNAPSSQYEILGGVVKAGEYTGNLRVKLKNSDLLKDSLVTLKLRIVDSEDFKVGNVELNEFSISWTDKIIVPTWNVYFRTFFTPVGSSNVYRLFVEITGLTSFAAADYGRIGEAGVIALATRFGDYIKQWEIDNGEDFEYDDGTREGQRVLPVHYTRSKYD